MLSQCACASLAVECPEPLRADDNAWIALCVAVARCWDATPSPGLESLVCHREGDSWAYEVRCRSGRVWRQAITMPRGWAEDDSRRVGRCRRRFST